MMKYCYTNSMLVAIDLQGFTQFHRWALQTSRFWNAHSAAQCRYLDWLTIQTKNRAEYAIELFRITVFIIHVSASLSILSYYSTI